MFEVYDVSSSSTSNIDGFAYSVSENVLLHMCDINIKTGISSITLDSIQD